MSVEKEEDSLSLEEDIKQYQEVFFLHPPVSRAALDSRAQEIVVQSTGQGLQTAKSIQRLKSAVECAACLEGGLVWACLPELVSIVRCMTDLNLLWKDEVRMR